ncbi:MAG: NADP-specific glutamate dehydrogenase [Clostridia bacterium]|nr:NADP-specific glutamate dehydrogenase [Clostridia bacterium]
MNSYLQEVIAKVKAKNPAEPEFIQTVEEVLTSLSPVFDAHPEYIKANIGERITEPERQIIFRVPWQDDEGNFRVNRGFRIQFSSVIGPFKGGLRFHPSVYLGTVKFLGFEQIFKNSLTGLPIGGGKGGSDFDPKGKSDTEIMRFCQSFMTELYRHIGPDIDVPAGDIGVGGKEIGYLYGQFKRVTGASLQGVLTGKSVAYGGSLIRPEATGYGAVFYLERMLEHLGDSVKGKTVVLSGYGNVTWGTAKKLAALGAKPVTISGSKGYVYDKDGVITDEKIDYLLEMRAKNDGNVLKDYAEKFGAVYYPGEKPWGVKGDIVMPCATQNEVDIEDAKKIAANGTKYYLECSNMSSTNEALAYLAEKMVVAPAKAVNAGGVAVSALEMSQNSVRNMWTEEKVEAKLKEIMINIHDNSAKYAEEYGLGYNLIAGANIAGFVKVADAMLEQGLV